MEGKKYLKTVSHDDLFCRLNIFVFPHSMDATALRAIQHLIDKLKPGQHVVLSRVDGMRKCLPKFCFDF